MSEFCRNKIGELASIIVGGTPSTTIPNYWNGNIPWMASGDVHLKRVKDVKGRITLDGFNNSNSSLVFPPSVAIALAGQGKTRGTAALIEIELCTNQSIALIKPNEEKLLARFLFHLLDAQYEELRSASAGGGRAGLSKGILEKYEINYPSSKGEQKTIAAILDTLDEAIAAAEALLAKQEKMKQGLLQDLLTRGVDENGQLRPQWQERPDLYHKTGLGWIPKDWKVKTIGEVCDSLVPGRDKPDLDGGGIPWITISDIQDSEFILVSKNNISLSKVSVKKATARLMPANTVLMSCVGEFGISAIAHNELVANQQLHGFICGNNILPEWLMMQIRTSRRRIELMATQTTISYLNKTGCESIKITLPEPIEQQKIFSIIKEFMDSTSLENNQLNKLHLLKTGLMQDLLTGRRRVTPELIQQVETLTRSVD